MLIGVTSKVNINYLILSDTSRSDVIRKRAENTMRLLTPPSTSPTLDPSIFAAAQYILWPILATSDRQVSEGTNKTTSLLCGSTRSDTKLAHHSRNGRQRRRSAHMTPSLLRHNKRWHPLLCPNQRGQAHQPQRLHVGLWQKAVIIQTKQKSPAVQHRNYLPEIRVTRRWPVSA